MAVTLKDIAEQIGVSNQAVSAVLNSKTNCRLPDLVLPDPVLADKMADQIKSLCEKYGGRS